MGELEDRVEVILTRALSFESAEERNRYLDDACGENEELRQEVLELLEAYQSSDSILTSSLTLSALDGATRVFAYQHDAVHADLQTVLAMLSQRPDDDQQGLGWLGDYCVLGVQGKGAMGIVFKAWDPKLSRHVAIKCLAPHLAGDPDARRRFVEEARSMATVRHENVVDIYWIEDNAATPYFVMEFVDGESLDKRLRRGDLPDVASTLRYSWQIASALAAAHQHGIVHRDIKTGNVLIEKDADRVKVTDFGLAVVVGREDTELTAGTPAFMSPEQINGDQTDVQTDLFALGCVIYALFVGRSPFAAKTTDETMRRVLMESPPDLAAQRPDIPDSVVDLLNRLLEKDPSRRPQSSDEVAQQLRDIYRRFARRQRFAERHPRLIHVARHWPIASAAVASAMIIAAAVVYWKYYDRQRHQVFVSAHDRLSQWGDARVKLPVKSPRVFIFRAENVTLQHEPHGGGRTTAYWRAANHAQWGELVLRLEFPLPLRSCQIQAPVQVFCHFDPEAKAEVYASADAQHWHSLFHLSCPGAERTPIMVETRQIYRVEAIAPDIRGQKHFFLKVRLFARDARKARLYHPSGERLRGVVEGPDGREIPIGPAYAQFLRSPTRLVALAAYRDE